MHYELCIMNYLKLPFNAKAWIDIEFFALAQTTEVIRHLNLTADIEVRTVEELSYVIPNLWFCDETELCHCMWRQSICPNIFFPPEICKTVKSQAFDIEDVLHSPN